MSERERESNKSGWERGLSESKTESVRDGEREREKADDREKKLNKCILRMMQINIKTLIKTTQLFGFLSKF